MRLICPNCGAQYDVADGSIPPAGREVQCSACGHAWFEIKAPDTDTAPPAAAAITPAADSSAPHPRRPIDETVKAILREEAARDSGFMTPVAAPQAPAPVTPPPATEPISQLRVRQPQLSAIAPAAMQVPAIVPPPATPAATVQSDMPSMDDINAQLRARSQSTQMQGPEQQAVAARRGFRRGFSLTLLVLAVAIAPYVLAPQIIAAAPQLQGGLGAYVAFVDQLRIDVNGLLTPILQQIRDLISG